MEKFIIDAIILVIVLIFAYIGYKRGLILSILGTLSFLVALFISIMITPKLSYLMNKNLEFNITSGLPKNLGDLFGITGFNRVPILSFFVIFIVILLLLKIFAHLLDIKEGPLGAVNKFCGMLLGICTSLIFIFIATMIIIPISYSILPEAKAKMLQSLVSNSTICNLIYEFNPIKLFF